MKKYENTIKNIKKQYDQKNLNKILSGNIDYIYSKKPTVKKKGFEESINAIVLWKINRDIKYGNNQQQKTKLLEGLKKLKNKKTKRNIIDIDDDVINILKELLKYDGVSLPVASAIINIYSNCKYPIYDQRAYRCISALQKTPKYKKAQNINSMKDEKQLERYQEYVDMINEYLGNNKLKEFKINGKRTKINKRNIDQFLYQIDFLTGLKIEY